MPIKGSLEEDAPAMNSALRAHLPFQDFSRIRTLYKNITLQYDLEELGTSRTPGSNFTPKPVRLIAILKNAGFSWDANITVACLIVGAGMQPTVKLSQEFPSGSKIANQAISILRGGSKIDDEPAATVVLAELIDRLRHLHLDKEADPRTVIRTARSLLEACPEFSTVVSKLLVLLAAAIERFEKYSCD